MSRRDNNKGFGLIQEKNTVLNNQELSFDISYFLLSFIKREFIVANESVYLMIQLA